MDKKQFKFLWLTVQLFLFVVPIVIGFLMVPYDISYDEEYVNNVNKRAFSEINSNSITDMRDAVIAKYDAEGTYLKKEWKLKHKEIYYFEGIGYGILIGLAFQLGNIVWYLLFEECYTSYY